MFFKKYLFLFLTVITFMSISASSYKAPTSQNLGHEICCYLLGRENASQNTQELFDSIKDNYKIASANRPSVKYINNCPFLQQFSSFTWWGTWINKDAWQEMSDEEKAWEAYHEVAHEKLRHPRKQVCVFLATVLGSKLITTKPLTFLLIGGILSRIIVPWYARKCEQQADIIAANILCSKNKKNIVKQHIEKLRQEGNEHESMWFKTPQQQINYLQKIVDKH